MSGPLLGLIVPLLLFFGNKHFGVSSSFQHICAAFSLKAEYFNYDWKGKAWNLVLMAGVIVGGAVAVIFLNGDVLPGVTEKAQSMFEA